MLKFSLCIEPVLTDLDFYDRIGAAAELGFDAVEFWEPTGLDVDRIANLAVKHKIAISLVSLLDIRGKRMNGDPKVVVANVRQSLKVAKDLGSSSMVVLAGLLEGRLDSQKSILIENLKRIADLAVAADVTINIEALNTLVDHKGYYLDSSSVGFEIVKCVNCSHVKFLYDIYHMQIMEGNIIETITRNIEWIGHFHSAGVPGRHEHFLGENDYRNIIKAIDSTGYQRYFGLEYWPSYDHHQSLSDVLVYLKS